VGNRLYAVGGSDGHVELDSVEMYIAPTDEFDSSRSMTASLESQSGSIDLSASSSIEDHHAIPANNQNGNGSNGTVAPNGGTHVNGSQQRKKAWTKRAKLPLARSYAGVCGGPEGRVYCIGGWAGQPGIRDCHVYSTEEDTWSEMSPLNTGNLYHSVINYSIIYVNIILGRYQAGVCIWGGALWVVGGCDAWHCLATTEVYGDISPFSNSSNGAWHFGKFNEI